MINASYRKASTIAMAAFIGLMVMHLVLWTVLPAWLRPSVPHDTLEAITWGAQWQWGYNKHPFLNAWLSYAVTALGGSTGWPIYLLAQCSILFSFWGVYRLARAYLDINRAIVATLILEGVMFFNINSVNFTPDTLQIPIWAWLSYAFYQACRTQRVTYWLFTSLLAALSVFTKYQAAIIWLPLIATLIFTQTGRASFKFKGFYIALIFGGVLAIPHVNWLMTHDFQSIHYVFTTAESYSSKEIHWPHLVYPAHYVFNYLGAALGLWIIVFFLIISNSYELKQDNIISESETLGHWTTVDAKKFLWAITFGPFLITLLLCAFTGDHFPSRWSTPYYVALGIWLVKAYVPNISYQRLKLIFWGVFCLIAINAGLRFGLLVKHLHTKDTSDASLPNQHIAQTIEKLWLEKTSQPLKFIGGSRYLVTSVAAYIRPSPKAFLSLDLMESPWINIRDFKYKGGVILIDETKQYVWDRESADITHVFEGLKQFSSVSVQWTTMTFKRQDNAGLPIRIKIGVLLPSLNKDLHNTKT